MSAKGEQFNRMDFLQKESFAETLSQLSAMGALLSVAANAGSPESYKMYVYVDASQYPASKLR